jgi:electron transfer flavoprotein alpha subunit
VELAVLVKGVPRSEAVRWDPGRRALVRDGIELVVNPFDQRALRVALELRRTGERVTVLSMGPPAVRPLLREALALGADRALHLCDPAFAGSDLLATSAALSAALRLSPPGLVLTGSRSTDSDTGLLGPEVAARLGWPIVGSVRSLRRPDEDGVLRAEVDTADGSADVEVALPAVVAVGEKIAKPLAVDPERFDRVPAGAVATVTPADLGLSPEDLGGFGSPTVVEAVDAVAPSRRGLRIDSGPPEARVRVALQALAPLLDRPSREPGPLPWPVLERSAPETVVLVSGADGATGTDALGLLTYLRGATPGRAVTATVYGPTPSSEARDRLETAGAVGGYALDPQTPRFDSGDVAGGLAALLALRPRIEAVVAPANAFGREAAGQLAASRSLGAVGDAIAVRSGRDGRLAWVKPSFGGSTAATVTCRSVPVVATMPGGLATPAGDPRAAGSFAWSPIPIPPALGRVRRLGDRREPSDPLEPDGADILVAVGTGVGGPEAIASILPTVRRWGAGLVGTRRVVDAGWLPVRRQVGLTGRLLAPRLAVLLGVRGAFNHMVGWARAGAVLAVNRDPEAPVFSQADVGIVGTVEEIVPALAAPLERLLGPDASRWRPRPPPP